MMKKIWRFLLISVVGFVVVYLGGAVALTFWPAPTFAVDPFLVEQSASADFLPQRFTARDGVELFARRFAAESDDVILLLHGVTGDSSNFGATAAMLSAVSDAEVIALDLRGHGQSGGSAGDVAYIGQYEDDVADIVAALRAGKPDGRLILAGHSMGGGTALRYAQLPDAPAVDGYLLFAPNLGATSPTQAPADSQAAEATAAYFQLHVPRLIGLSMLNGLGITTFNGQPTMFFNLTDEATHTYSYRAMVNSSPVDYGAALAAADRPLLVLVGEADEVFVAEQYPDAVAQFGDGDVHIIAGEDHNGIYESAEAFDIVGQWLDGIQMMGGK